MDKEYLDKHFKGINDQFKSIDDQFKNVNDQFKSVNDQFKNVKDQFKEVHNRLDNITTKMATKEDLKKQSQELMNYTDTVAQTIIEAVDSGFKKVDKRLTRLESVRQI